MCHVLYVLCLFGNLSCSWSCACQPFDFGVQAFARNIQQLISRQASEAVSACNFLGQQLALFICQTSFISARVNKSGPGIGSQ